MIIANELKFGRQICVNKLHLCANFQFSSSNCLPKKMFVKASSVPRLEKVFTLKKIILKLLGGWGVLCQTPAGHAASIH